MQDIQEYLKRAQEYMKTEDLGVSQTPFGYVFEKGNTYPSPTEFSVDENVLQLQGRVLHERILLIERNIPIRSHEEVSQEVIRNIGDQNIVYTEPGRKLVMWPWCQLAMYSVNGENGFFHGFEIEEGKSGLLYVAKALKPEYVDGNSFTIPENTYEPSVD